LTENIVQYPELAVSSYNKNPLAPNEPDGVALVWNLHLLDRPEFVFHSQVKKKIGSFPPYV
jgi:dynein intermediate chain